MHVLNFLYVFNLFPPSLHLIYMSLFIILFVKVDIYPVQSTQLNLLLLSEHRVWIFSIGSILSKYFVMCRKLSRNCDTKSFLAVDCKFLLCLYFKSIGVQISHPYSNISFTIWSNKCSDIEGFGRGFRVLL